MSVAGSRWDTSASPSLAHLIRGAALDVSHPTDPARTLWDARQDTGPFGGGIDSDILDFFVQAKKENVESDLSIAPLGSGSDYTPFLQRLGVSGCHP